MQSSTQAWSCVLRPGAFATIVERVMVGSGDFLGWLGDRVLGPAVVAVVFAGTTTVIIERYRGRRDAVSKMADGLRDDLRAVQELAIGYWSRPAAADDSALEARITAHQSDVIQTLGLVHEAIGLEPSRGNLDEAISELLDALTGGEFQTATRAADLQRAARVHRVIGDLRSAISRARLRQLSVAPWRNGPRA